MPEAPKPKAKMRPEDNGETKLQRSAGSEGRDLEARFFWGTCPIKEAEEIRKNKQKNAQMLLKFVASLVCWLIFFWGGGQTEETSQKGGHIHKVEKCVGRLESVFLNVFLFEINIGLVPTKLEAFEPTTSKKSISTK